jgi:hypothetical protein
MNILYIGPYRLNNSLGHESLNFLLELYDNYSNLITRPVYNTSDIIKNNEISSLLSSVENKNCTKINLVIQHLDIDSFVYNSKINHHIFIPIQNNRLCEEYQKEKYQFLNRFGYFLYRNEIQNYILNNSSVTNKNKIEPVINDRFIINDGVFNLGLYNKYEKYYSVVDSSDDIIIKQIIISFIKKYQDEQKCLILFMQNTTQPILESYNKFIKKAYASLDINFSINKVIVSPIEINSKIVSAIHNTGNIYIDLNEDVHTHYAKKYNKPIIDNNSCIIEVTNIDNLNKTPSLVRSENIKLILSQTPILPETLSLSQVVEKYV